MNNEASIGGVWGLSVIAVTCFVYFTMKFTFWQSLYIGVFWPLWILESHLFPAIGCR
jgi:hypothetical protein